MDDAQLMHRLHFGFTVTFHYLFPQLTMGLAPQIVILKTPVRYQRWFLRPIDLAGVLWEAASVAAWQ